ncbi:MAG: response regulator [Oligoflexales bacterium]|nr:response regulator [Oligoflexales bacterium]
MNKVLIVDDSRAALLALSGQLDADQYSVQTAQSAAEAFKLLESISPDCILTDYEMPDVDGPAFCRQLKEQERFQHIPVIVLTSMTGSDYLLVAIDAGADDFILKDSDIRVIKAKITAMIRIKRFRDELTRLRRIEGIKQIIATYNHEFNNPLTIAIGNLNWLKKNHVGEEQLTRIGRLAEALERMSVLVKKIRDLRDYVESSYTSGENIVKVHGESE